MKAQPKHAHIAHTFLHVSTPIHILSRCLLTKFLHRSSVGSLLRVRCWLGTSFTHTCAGTLYYCCWHKFLFCTKFWVFGYETLVLVFLPKNWHNLLHPLRLSVNPYSLRASTPVLSYKAKPDNRPTNIASVNLVISYNKVFFPLF